jgi:hypothetical protein
MARKPKRLKKKPKNLKKSTAAKIKKPTKSQKLLKKLESYIKKYPNAAIIKCLWCKQEFVSKDKTCNRFCSVSCHNAATKTPIFPYVRLIKPHKIKDVN